MKNKILITGSSGFIGYHLTKKLITSKKNLVFGIDMMNNYYSKKLKNDRLDILLNIGKKNNNFKFESFNISNKKKLSKVFSKFKPNIIINLAAQAGVRDSIVNPYKYLDYNIKGFMNILELSKNYNISKIIYASTSSIYGTNKPPFNENSKADNPIQFYAVTKKTNELMAHTWSYLYDIPTIGLRFFTVYGPWGRPDMALYKFVDRISKDKKIDVFNFGDHIRDFTYVEDIINGIIASIKLPKSKIIKIGLSPNENIPSVVFNLGSGKNIPLSTFISIIEKKLGKKAIIDYLPMQRGDVHTSLADLKFSRKNLKYNPRTMPEEGISKFINWYKFYNNY